MTDQSPSHEACAEVVLQLSSRDTQVVKQAAYDAADGACVDAIPSLLTLLEAGDEEILGAVAYALGELKVEEAKPRLVRLLKDPKTKGKRGSLVYALMCLDCKAYYHDILNLLSDDYFEVRQKATIITEEIIPFQSDDDLTVSRSEISGRLIDIKADDARSLELQEALELIESEIVRRITSPR